VDGKAEILSTYGLDIKGAARKVNERLTSSLSDEAGVAKPGQRRRAQAPVPQGFVGSNPTPRTYLLVSYKYLFSYFCLMQYA
jgi:hypothetical protein